LVLPDPERFISRTHATISFQAGGYLITDTGTKNPVVVNGRPLGSGSQARLGDGDQIKVGDYMLQVAVTAAQRAASGLPCGAGRAERARPVRPISCLQPHRDPARGARDPSPAAPARPPAEPPRVPEFNDPLAGIRGPEPSIDDLIGPKASGAAEILRSTFLSEKPVSPSHAAEASTIFSASSRALESEPVARCSRSRIRDPHAVHAARGEARAHREASARGETRAGDEAQGRGAAARPTTEGSACSRRSPDPAGERRAAGPQEQALLRAFLQGAGISGIQSKSLTPEAMEAIGKLLREAVQGSSDLAARPAAHESEMRPTSP